MLRQRTGMRRYVRAALLIVLLLSVLTDPLACHAESICLHHSMAPPAYAPCNRPFPSQGPPPAWHERFVLQRLVEDDPSERIIPEVHWAIVPDTLLPDQGLRACTCVLLLSIARTYLSIPISARPFGGHSPPHLTPSA